mmetsp:Transcript_13225/g.28008  ORF Transcript_13225/g.28008 Transcript_13225/m.28008 type:complete len:203 (-) Transcript_13225:629-1237(-)
MALPGNVLVRTAVRNRATFCRYLSLPCSASAEGMGPTGPALLSKIPPANPTRRAVWTMPAFVLRSLLPGEQVKDSTVGSDDSMSEEHNLRAAVRASITPTDFFLDVSGIDLDASATSQALRLLPPLPETESVPPPENEANAARSAPSLNSESNPRTTSLAAPTPDAAILVSTRKTVDVNGPTRCLPPPLPLPPPCLASNAAD